MIKTLVKLNVSIVDLSTMYFSENRITQYFENFGKNLEEIVKKRKDKTKTSTV